MSEKIDLNGAIIDNKTAVNEINESSDNKKAKAEEIIKTYDEIPPNLKKFVSQSVWDLWSPSRKDSFCEMMINPNKFFYRNRPPGEHQKSGKFSEEEMQQFMDRLKFFKDKLDINNSLWGFFAVPLVGRVGYQCSNLYRQLVRDGKVQDECYQLVDGKLKFERHGKRCTVTDETTKLLTDEAIEYINKCMSNNDGEVPMMDKPVKYTQNSETKKSKAKNVNEKSEKEIEKELSSMFGISRNLPDRYYNPIEEHLTLMNIQKENEIAQKRSLFAKENKTPLVGRADPLTGNPIKIPMIDESGFVMDLKSWRMVFNGEKDLPYDAVAESEKEITEVTHKNFNALRLNISNIPC